MHIFVNDKITNVLMNPEQISSANSIGKVDGQPPAKTPRQIEEALRTSLKVRAYPSAEELHKLSWKIEFEIGRWLHERQGQVISVDEFYSACGDGIVSGGFSNPWEEAHPDFLAEVERTKWVKIQKLEGADYLGTNLEGKEDLRIEAFALQLVVCDERGNFILDAKREPVSSGLFHVPVSWVQGDVSKIE